MDGEAVLNEAAEAYRAAFGERLIASYALGSLAHGGFSPLVSDVDLGLILSDPVADGDADAIQRIADTEKAKGSELHQRLSVFWGTRSTLSGRSEGGRFPPLDRLDLLDNGRLLAGTEARDGLPCPDRIELLVTGAEFALDFLAGFPRRPGPEPDSKALGSLNPAGQDATDDFRSPEMLVAQGVRQVTKVVLFPGRFLYTAATGEVGTNEAAATRYLEDADAPSTALVAAALRWRRQAWSDAAQARHLLEDELVALYVHYIDDHVA